ncbi:hypothetical protein [Viridibacillus arvi]|uniref:hypothetical protein n=1 Tax=Viridibacillus arvi TaxID=263475 RepID=UPI003D28E186
MKKISTLAALTFVLLLSYTGFDVKAMENNEENIPEIIDGKTMSIQEVDELLNSSTDHTIELTDQQVAEQYALKKDVSIEKAYQEMSDYSVSGKPTMFASPSESCSWLATNTAITIPGKSGYKPNLIVYTEICRGGAQYINTNKKPLLQEFQANPISFAGTIKVELFNGHFYYIINGNFYNSTSTSHSGTTGITSIFSATYTVGTTSNYYASLTTPRTKRDVLGY